MKIHSDFKDYYDPVLKYLGGEDDNINYVRKTEEIDITEKDYEVTIPRGYRDRYFSYRNIHVIGFCGKIYYCTRVNLSNYYVGMDNEKIIEEVDKMDNSGGYHYWSAKEIGYLIGHEFDLQDYWRNLTFHNPLKFEELFVRYSVPCFSFGLKYVSNVQENNSWKEEIKQQLILNPCLKDYSFQRVMDPNTALQELRMYFSSVMTEKMNAKMPVGDDKVLAASKGFDKWSFRKTPTKKK